MIEERNFSLLAFHGTYESAAVDILGTSFNMGKRRPDHWLGQGVYFFREDLKQALIWGKTKIKRTIELHGQRAAVLETIINTKSTEFLNLDTRDGMELFDEFALELNRFNKEHGIEFNVDNPNVLRCLYCDQLPKTVKVIQRTFTVESKYDGKTLFQDVDLRLQGIQLCVRDISSIDQQSTKLVKLEEVYIPKQRKRLEPTFDKKSE